MKYVVKLTYTNPAHEHVTLRRRVDTVNRIVEAASEQEALNRAANQQRALGFKIQEATIVEQEKASVKTEQLTEASKEGSAVMRGMRATLKSMDLRHGVDSDKREAGYKMSPAVKAAQAKSDVLSKVVKRPQAGTLAAVHKSMEREMTRNMKEEVEYIEEKLTAADPASKWISDFVKSDNPKFAGKSKKERINQALGAYYAAKRGNVEEGYDPSSAEIAKMLVKKHGAGNVTKQHILDMEADRDSRKALDHDEIMQHVKKMSEEVEQLSEGPSHYQYSGTIHSNVGNAKHGEEKDDGHSYTITIPTGGVHQGDLGSFLSSKKAFSRISRENPHLEPHHVLAVMHGTGDDVEDVEVDHKGKTYKHRLYNTQEPDYLYEEVELDEAQKKLRPSYWKAEWRLGTQSEVDKNNKKIFDKLAKTDPVKASAFHDNLMRMRKKDMKEEFEQVDEGVATAQKVMDRANVVAKTNPDPKKRFAAGGLANKAMMRTINPTGVNTGITRGGGNKAYRKITGKAPPHQLTKKTGVSEEVVAEANTRVVNKEVKKEKAAETAVAAARRAKNTKNKVETEPRLDMDVGSSEKKYVTKV